jgi:glycosyltransferase involved in cell wall biosynthesis
LKTKFLFVQEFGSAVPSGKIRGKIYEKEFKKKGITCKFVNRNNEFLIYRIQMQNNKFWIILLSLLNNFYKTYSSIKIIFISFSFNVIWLNKVLSPTFIKLLRILNKNKIINLDVVDNPYENNKKWLKSLKYVTSITTDNFYNKSKLLNFHNNIFIIPDYPLIHKFKKFKKNENDINFNFGWIGSKSTYNLIKNIERELFYFLELNPFSTLYLLGVPKESKLNELPNVISITNYDEKTMVDILNILHVGLFPLDHSLSSEVRGVLKATLYMASTTVVIADPIGEINDLIINYENGLLTKNSNWFDCLTYLNNNRDELRKIAINGYNKVQLSYSLEHNFSTVLDICKI